MSREYDGVQIDGLVFAKTARRLDKAAAITESEFKGVRAGWHTVREGLGLYASRDRYKGSRLRPIDAQDVTVSSLELSERQETRQN
ncbi:unannotated protein [freshwater metagenome]|uniref:Unannotated protein n=1 Tax=freshwater metagenome TaxID=449393 RepID=A0A6J6VVF0_9ZZZZ